MYSDGRVGSPPTCVICGETPRTQLRDDRCHHCYRHIKVWGTDEGNARYKPDGPTTRRCPTCLRELNLEMFPNEAVECAQCNQPAAFRRALRTTPSDRAARRARHYGVTAADLLALYEMQDHRCGICGKAYLADSLVIDQDRKSVV